MVAVEVLMPKPGCLLKKTIKPMCGILKIRFLCPRNWFFSEQFFGKLACVYVSAGVAKYVDAHMFLAFMSSGDQERPGQAKRGGKSKEEHVQSPGLEGALGLLGSRDRRSLCPELKEREGSSQDADAKASMLVKKEKKSLFG